MIPFCSYCGKNENSFTVLTAFLCMGSFSSFLPSRLFFAASLDCMLFRHTAFLQVSFSVIVVR